MKREKETKTIKQEDLDKEQKLVVRKKITIKGILSFVVIFVIVRNVFTGNFENVFMGILTLILFSIPMLIDRHLKIDIPHTLETIILLFIFAAEILGEVDSFYTKFKHWDTMLHTINGFLMAAIGFALVDIFNRSERFTFRLSSMFLAVTAFCFSMTVGVLWEFFECAMDIFFKTDMQKDYIVTEINSVIFNSEGLNVVEHVPIKTLVVNGEDWMARFGGYIDIGLVDTMKDMFVNFIGAAIFSVIGYFYVKNRGHGKFAKRFIPIVKGEND